jgi:hypothetical protein
MIFNKDFNQWCLLYLLVVCVFGLGFYDPQLRPQAIEFGKVALGGVLALITATARGT